MSHLEFFNRLAKICPVGSTRDVSLKTGQILFHQEDAPPGLLYLEAGQIDLLRHTETGRRVRIHAAQAEETFAEASIFSEKCHCDAMATEASRVRLVPRAHVLAALSDQPDIAQDFALHLAQSLMKARRLLELRAITPLRERVLARVSDLADAQGALPRKLPLTSIAADLDVSPPALYRALAELEQQGILTRPARGKVLLVTS